MELDLCCVHGNNFQWYRHGPGLDLIPQSIELVEILVDRIEDHHIIQPQEVPDLRQVLVSDLSAGLKTKFLFDVAHTAAFYDDKTGDGRFDREDGLLNGDAHLAVGLVPIFVQEADFRPWNEPYRNRGRRCRVELDAMMISAGFEGLCARQNGRRRSCAAE